MYECEYTEHIPVCVYVSGVIANHLDKVIR